jgi:porphobilinogen synthase
VPQGIQKMKEQVPGLVVIADVCLCEYTDHGHCGPLHNNEVDNDAALPLLARTATAYARAGADIVAPSDMMDGRIAAIRQALDDEKCADTPILSYAAKTASSFYGPFRDAADSAPSFGDRRGYQMDPANAREALREIELDINEGADAIMVKPALPMLDIIRGAKERFEYPLFAYQVSGEFSMIKAAAQLGWLDEERTFAESLVSIMRAGADAVITYWALEAAEFFK